MAEKVLNLLNFVVWLTGVIVSLTVGFAMAEGSLTIVFLNSFGFGIVTIIAGWVVVVTTVISIALVLFRK
jgi:hypothetical protein